MNFFFEKKYEANLYLISSPISLSHSYWLFLFQNQILLPQPILLPSVGTLNELAASPVLAVCLSNCLVHI